MKIKVAVLSKDVIYWTISLLVALHAFVNAKSLLIDKLLLPDCKHFPSFEYFLVNKKYLSLHDLHKGEKLGPKQLAQSDGHTISLNEINNCDYIRIFMFSRKSMFLSLLYMYISLNNNLNFWYLSHLLWILFYI